LVPSHPTGAGWAPFVWLDGEVMASDQARISVFDRGFLLGDGVYETMRVVEGRMFRWRRHWERLLRSLSGARIEIPYSISSLEDGIAACLEANRLREARLRLTISRGAGYPGFDLDPGGRPTVLVAASAWHPLPEEAYRQGVAAIVPRIRQTGRESLDPGLKSTSRIHLALARMEATDRGAREAILLGVDGAVREGTASNVFIVANGRLKTPSTECGILEGVTREAVLEVASAGGRAGDELVLGRKDLDSADEIFLTNTSWGVLPVTRLDGNRVGSAVAGPVARELRGRLEELVTRECRGA
jgi:branched-chain amino acid aminotransferase